MDDPSLEVGGAFHVLVADDSLEVRELLFEALSSIDCTVTCVGDGQEALASLEAGPYDLLITDYNMPRLNGMVLLRCSRALAPRLAAAILITGQASPDVIDEAERAGATFVIPKPFAIPHILSLVEFIRDRRPLV
jgi:two-component system chemotaxis response regulator CheY